MNKQNDNTVKNTYLTKKLGWKAVGLSWGENVGHVPCSSASLRQISSARETSTLMVLIDKPVHFFSIFNEHIDLYKKRNVLLE
jgi:hypothetical protein